MSMGISKPQYQLTVAGENALMLYFDQRIDPAISALVQQACVLIRAELAADLIDVLPSYASVLVMFNPLCTDHFRVQAQLQHCLAQLQNSESHSCKRVELPVYYSEESGPDLALIAQTKNISIDDVIQRHQAVSYRVYAIGFAPGFAYLGEVDPLLQMPRLATPRAKVPRGAVAIADRQTAVYPAASPGGWNLIGLCPTRMFNPQQTPAMPVSVGDEVRFVAIDKAEFLRLGGELQGAEL
ncbi:sensor histidine kinase inhibitor, KipI family [Rheinheimera pacifica]|uniref:Sensor histidine kinase inhibitor, KipI family n=1 Tax=Rheinheimera pacifica TaxID=173990 RepID=A0A1H6J1N5_9GAMM|nr:5-oxoprolinase subunit PxpB [Rheinheimera pacifica]SEH55784.1 sensor histidine kinase inhibitor, KipI family [Rheinheimera pacifica]